MSTTQLKFSVFAAALKFNYYFFYKYWEKLYSFVYEHTLSNGKVSLIMGSGGERVKEGSKNSHVSPGDNSLLNEVPLSKQFVVLLEKMPSGTAEYILCDFFLWTSPSSYSPKQEPVSVDAESVAALCSYFVLR